MKTYIKGNYRKTIFSSNNYIIGLFKIRETNDLNMTEYINKTITFTGYFHDLSEDDNYYFYGEIVNHPRYGVQYQVNDYERIKPEDKNGIIDFLSSDLFKGIGLKLATSIVDTLGLDAIDKILNDKSVLMLVPHITIKKIDSIYETLSQYEFGHKNIVYLTELGIPLKDSINIFNIYKNDTINIVKNNIYQIIDDIEDFSFSKLDKIRHNFDIEDDHPNRVKAAIVSIMKDICFKTGDTFLDKYEIYENLKNKLRIEISIETLEEYLNEINKIKIDKDRYYLKNLWESENYIANKVIHLANKEIEPIKKIDKYLEELEKHEQIKYNDKQKQAITKSLENNILIITGGPGTGKTTIIKAIVELYSKINNLAYEELIQSIALLAPTGRASKRISDKTLLPAMTIHRFLKWNKENNEFIINETNPDFSHLIIIDEVSMIDVELLSNLLKGLTDNIKLILVGDYNQLPSVGPGQVLKDLIESNIIDTIKLDLLYRQDEDSYIYKLAEEIKSNEISDDFNQSKSDYIFLECNNIKENLKNICQKTYEKYNDYKKVQVMAPMYMGENGIDNLNVELQKIFNPQNKKLNDYKYGDIIYRENDKVIQLTNMPDENIFNGDIGIIKYIENNDNKYIIHIDFDGNIVKYNPQNLNKIKHAYIISIHKSQGNEFDVVIIPISMSYKRMLYRKLVYTAVTRAKEKLIIIGDKKAFLYAVSNNNEYLRKTSLLEKILDNLNKI